MFGKKFAWGSSFTLLLLLNTSFTTTVGFVSLTQVSAASGIDLDTFYDNFNDNSIDASLWGTGSFPGSDALVTVNEVNGQLVITPRAGQTGLHYNGLISNRTYNLTQGIIFVEVVEVTRSQADTTFAFGADNNNKVVMEVENGSLYMRLLVSGSNVGATAIPYDTVSYRWWRIRHVASNDTIRFDTSPDGITWTQRHSIARGALNITAGKVNLSAGTWNSQSSPGRAVFDNLSWHPLVPNKGDWSAEATAISPNPTPGTWDHILWGAASPATMVKFNGTYFLYYIGAEGDTGDPNYEAVHRSLGVATSTNGINFTKYGSNPIIAYTTTSGSAPEEGVGSATAIVVGSTIHLYYGAIRSIGGGLVDMDIRYRRSTDGYTFTNDTLIYRSPGDEYSPLGVTNNGSTWSVYIKGPLTDGKGALSRLSGTSPTSLPNKTSVTSTTFGAGGNANYIRDDVFIMHLDRRQPTEDRFQVRAINIGSPDAVSEPLFSYTFGSYGDRANPATFKDSATGKWFMYTLNLATDPAVISVRTYMPPQIVTPTATSMVTATRTPSPTGSIATPTRTPTLGGGKATSTRTSTLPATSASTATPTQTLAATSTRTPTPPVTFTSTPTPTRTFTATPGSVSGIHVGDLDGSANANGQNWRVVVTVTVHDQNHQPVANVRVDGHWSNGYTGTASCVTDNTGSCTLETDRADRGSSTITFTVDSMSHSSLPYLPASNHDPDGDSNGKIINIQKP